MALTIDKTKRNVCPVCGKPTTITLSDGVEVNCLCACQAEIYAKEKRDWEIKMKQYSMESRQKSLQPGRSNKGKTFDAAMQTGGLLKCKRYVDNWSTVYRENMGLLLYGPSGTGKSYAAACIINALYEKGVDAMSISAPRISELSYVEIDDMIRRKLMVIDDLGAERQTSFGLEKLFYFIDARYESHKPLIATTNLAYSFMKGLTKDPNETYARLYDRIITMCAPISFTNQPFREAERTAKIDKLSGILRG